MILLSSFTLSLVGGWSKLPSRPLLELDHPYVSVWSEEGSSCGAVFDPTALGPSCAHTWRPRWFSCFHPSSLGTLVPGELRAICRGECFAVQRVFQTWYKCQMLSVFALLCGQPDTSPPRAGGVLFPMRWVCNTTASSSEGGWALVEHLVWALCLFCSLFSGSFHTHLSTLSHGLSLTYQSPFTPFCSWVLKGWAPTLKQRVELLGTRFWIGFIPGSVYVPTLIFPLPHLAWHFLPDIISRSYLSLTSFRTQQIFTGTLWGLKDV